MIINVSDESRELFTQALGKIKQIDIDNDIFNYYTGIGSRKTPEIVLVAMYLLSYRLANLDWTLRTGGADGADYAFERGCLDAKGDIELYLPWVGFNGAKSDMPLPNKAAYEMAAAIHPAWHHCSRGARALHARNAYQVLGENLDLASRFVVCYTKDGELVGGTRTALVIAQEAGIPIINFGEMYDE
jgi:hypothetical protein